MELDKHTPSLEPGDNPTHTTIDRTAVERIGRLKRGLRLAGNAIGRVMLSPDTSQHDAASSAMVERVKQISAEQRTDLGNQAQDLSETQLLEQSGVSSETLSIALQHGLELARQLRKIQTEKPRGDAERRARQATPDVDRKKVAIERGVKAGLKLVEAESERPLNEEAKIALETVLRSVIVDNVDNNGYAQRLHRVHGAMQYME